MRMLEKSIYMPKRQVSKRQCQNASDETPSVKTPVSKCPVSKRQCQNAQCQNASVKMPSVKMPNKVYFVLDKTNITIKHYNKNTERFTIKNISWLQLNNIFLFFSQPLPWFPNNICFIYSISNTGSSLTSFC